MALSIIGTKFRGTTDAGAPLVGGLLYTYVSDTTTNKTTYSDALLTTPNANPVVLDARGEADVYLGQGLYTFVLKTSAGVTIDTVDNQSSTALDLSASSGASLIGHEGRTVAAWLGDIPSVMDDYGLGVPTADGVTDDTAKIAAAVAAAYGSGSDLYWPDYDFATTASIANFHSVRHWGPGRVKRTGSTFYVDPKEGQSNTIYIATTGNNANDGLSANQPKLTFQGAFDACENYGPTLSGSWSIVAAAGTYTISAGQQTFSTPSKNRVVIRGPAAGHPSVPTAIIDGGGNQPSYRHGLSASGNGVQVEFRDLKAQNFTEASGNTRIGFVGENGADVYWNNCHTYACTWTGIYGFSIPRVRIAGGILDGAGNAAAACVIMNETECTLGYGSTSTATGPILQDAGIGVYWSRGTQGHIDWCTIQDCGKGAQIGESSRVDIVGNNWKRNTTAIFCMSGGGFNQGGAANVFNQGTADANTNVYVYGAYSGDLDEQITGQSFLRVAYDRTTRSASGVVTDTFPTIYTIPAYRMQGVGKSCRIVVYGIYTMTSGNTLTCNIGGMALSLAVSAAATSAMFKYEIELHEVAGGYRAFGTLGHSLSAARTGTASAGFSNSTDQAISIGYNMTGAGDSLTIYRTDVYLMG